MIYGHGREPLSLAIDTRELEKLLSRISAESTVIELSFDGSTARTLIREIQRHPFKRQILHVDFQELVAGEKVDSQTSDRPRRNSGGRSRGRRNSRPDDA